MLRLYRRPPDDGVVICFDKHGPITPTPHAGWGVDPGPQAAAPSRHYRDQRVHFFFGAYDVARDQLTGRWYGHKTGADVFALHPPPLPRPRPHPF